MSPSSIAEGKGKSRDKRHPSLNSSRMTGTQELSIHEGMQVIHEMENQHNLKHAKHPKKMGANKESNEVVFNMGSLNTDKLMKKDSTHNITQSSLRIDQQQEIEIDENIVQYTIEQFLDENCTSQNQNETDSKN